MAVTVKQLLEAANAAVPRVTPAQAKEMMAKGNTLVVDVRDTPEVEQSGKVAGAVHVSRGMLEFRADPESPYHDPNFAKDKTVIVYCASGSSASGDSVSGGGSGSGNGGSSASSGSSGGDGREAAAKEMAEAMAMAARAGQGSLCPRLAVPVERL